MIRISDVMKLIKFQLHYNCTSQSPSFFSLDTIFITIQCLAIFWVAICHYREVCNLLAVKDFSSCRPFCCMTLLLKNCHAIVICQKSSPERYFSLNSSPNPASLFNLRRMTRSNNLPELLNSHL